MGITEERMEGIKKQAEIFESIGKAARSMSSELEAVLQDNLQMERQIECLNEANDRLRERLNRSENHDEYMKLPLDADGKPIRVGDEMVGTFAEKPVIVDGYRHFPVCGKWGFTAKGNPGICDPSDYRHKQPGPADSWEKLEEDARKSSCDYASAPLDENGFFTCDGCRFQNGGPCHLKKDIDLMERAKKLAGIEGEGQR